MDSPIEFYQMHVIYWLFLAYAEPFQAIMGGFITHFRSHYYYTSNANMTSAEAAATIITPATQIALSQLATMYVGFGLTEIIITRLSRDMRLWRAYVLALVAHDALYLYSMRPLGLETYWRPDRWNLVTWGDFGILYVNTIIRLCFLAGVGVKRTAEKDE